MKNKLLATIPLVAVLWSSHSLPQSPSDDDLSKETENPVTRHITFPLRYEADLLDGADKLTRSVER
jgi:hypothetical protein